MSPDEKLDVVLSKLRRVRPKVGGGFTACCPAHEDRNPSFDIGIGRSHIVFHCHRGCGPDKVVEATGLTWQDFMLEVPTGPKTRRRDWRAIELESLACAARLQNEPEVLRRFRYRRGWAAAALEELGVGWDGSRLTLPVRDRDGKLHDVLRYDPFATKRKMIAGRGKSRLPWPAPESVKADTVFLVEGEGTALSMFSIGLKAVALPGSIALPTTSIQQPGRWRGTGWHKAWARRFEHFRQIVILPDCDGQGRALAGAARYDLARSTEARVEIIDLGPKVHDGSDVADILLSTAWDGTSRRAAKETLREIVAEQAELLVA